ncbi:unnamed protein product [Caretta caretta]
MAQLSRRSEIEIVSFPKERESGIRMVEFLPTSVSHFHSDCALCLSPPAIQEDEKERNRLKPKQACNRLAADFFGMSSQPENGLFQENCVQRVDFFREI